MKPLTTKIKKDAIKSKEEIDALITQMDDSKDNFGGFVPVQSSQNQLVDDKFYLGNLFPMIKDYMPEDMDFTPEEKLAITKGVQRKLTGLSANMPIKCYGGKCPFKEQCPLAKVDKMPVGKNCPIEAIILDMTTKRYLDEFEVDPDDYSEVTTMSMLAATHIMELRGFMAIGKDEENESPDGIIKNVVGYTPDEDPITQYQIHPGYEIIERAWRWRSKLLESLGATRKEKNKLGDDDGSLVRSLSEANAKLRAKIDSLTTIKI